MSYIGRGLQSGAFRQLDDISSGFDGSDTTHTMQVNSTNVTVGDVNQILLSLGGVIQKPGTDFTVSSSTLTFTTAPAANTSFFAILLGSDNGGTVTPSDNSVTDSKIPSTGAFTIGAAGTASNLAGIPFYRNDTSSIYTHDVSGTDDTAALNTAYGITALDAITTGDNNTVVGSGAGSALNTGHRNTLMGQGAGSLLTEATHTVAIGNAAASGYDTETNNIAIGHVALGGSVNGGEYNIAIGNTSLDALTSADYVTAVGNNAGTAITTGGKHVLIGHNAGSGLTTSATSCIYIGTGAGSGSNNDTETGNIGIGEDTMGGAGNTINGAEYNVAIGYTALDALTSGDHNVAIGYEAGSDMTTAGQSVLIGSAAGVNLTTGATSRTIMIGYAAGYYVADETNNIGIGALACGGAGTVNGGEYNTAIGNLSLDALTSGDYNVAVGHNAAGALNSGSTNTCVGVEAGFQLTSGGNNTLIGVEAGRSSSPSTVTTGSDNIVLGNNSVSDAFIKVDWTVTSDKRDKTDIEPLTMGLDFVNKLNPVTYRWDMRSDYENKTPDGTHKKQRLFSGLLAQDVEKLERTYNYKVEDETAVITNKGEDGNYGLTYSKFVPVLINAVQELSAQVTTLQQELKTLKGG